MPVREGSDTLLPGRTKIGAAKNNIHAKHQVFEIIIAEIASKSDRASSGQMIIYASSVGRERYDATIYSLQPLFICLQSVYN